MTSSASKKRRRRREREKRTQELLQRARSFLIHHQGEDAETVEGYGTAVMDHGLALSAVVFEWLKEKGALDAERCVRTAAAGHCSWLLLTPLLLLPAAACCPPAILLPF